MISRARYYWRFVADAQSFEVIVLIIALARGASYISGFLPASVAEQALPKWLLIAALVELALGSLVALVGLIGKMVDVEISGLKLLWPSALVYGVILEYERPRSAALSLIIYVGIAWASRTRIKQVHRLEVTLHKAAEATK